MEFLTNYTVDSGCKTLEYLNS